MFIALEPAGERNGKGIIGRLAGILTRPKARLREAEAFGVRYRRLTVPLRKGRPDWSEIGALAGHLAGRILLPDSMPLPGLMPPHSRLAPFACPRYERRMLAGTAALLIRRSGMPMYRRVLGLVDRDGSFSDLLPGLLRHFTAARVVTGREELYEAAAEEIMGELGAPVLVGRTLSRLAGCALILAPGSAFGEEEGGYPCPVLAGEAFLPRLPCDLLRAPEPEVTAEFLNCCPPGIDPCRFAAALYEDAGAEPLGFVPVRLRCNARQADIEIIAGFVTERAKPLSLY